MVIYMCTATALVRPLDQKYMKLLSPLIGSPTITIHYYPQARKIIVKAPYHTPIVIYEERNEDLITPIMEFFEKYGYKLTRGNETISYSWYEYEIPEYIMQTVDNINNTYKYPCVTVNDALLVIASNGKWNIVEKGLGNVVVKFNDPLKTERTYGNVCYDALLGLSDKLLYG